MQDDSVYYRAWGSDNIAYGPVELPALVDWVRQGRVFRDTWVYREAKEEWAHASQIPELKGLFKTRTPAVPQPNLSHGLTPGSLRRMKLFADLEERQLESFLQYMEIVKLRANEVVFKKGEHGDSMFLVLEGEVRARVSVGGKESTLSTLGIGDCFGELAVIDESPRSAEVVANLESVLLKVSAAALKRLFQEAPALAAPFLLALNRTITSRVRTLTKRYEDSILFARTANQK